MLAIRVNQVFDGTQVAAGAGVIFIDEGRIIGIESMTADIPEECRVLDYPTATVLPGLVDAHVHLLADSGPGALDRLADYFTRRLRPHHRANASSQSGLRRDNRP